MHEFNKTEKDINEAERIRRQYLEKNENKMTQLQELDNKVKLPGKIVSLSIGIIGALILGSGMSLIMIWSNMTTGLILGIPGLILLFIAYPLYEHITNKRKKEFAKDIISLSDELINE